MQNFFGSKVTQTILILLAVLIVMTAVFAAGVGIGERKARHFADWSNNYERFFGGRRGGSVGPGSGYGMGPGMMGAFRGMPNSQGTSGKILSLSGSSLIVQGRDNLEQEVIVSSSTALRSGRETVGLGDLRSGMDVTVFGIPNQQGQIEARLIRIFSTTRQNSPQAPVVQVEPTSTR